MADKSKRKKVCVIGAGAAGLCALRHFSRSSNFIVTAYEQTDDVGGTWVYREQTGTDENGSPVHSSMYRDLRTNLPGKLMNFPDYQTMNAEDPCCVTHQEVRNYLNNYAEHFDLLKYIQFGRRVESVRLAVTTEGTEQWIVRVNILKTKEQEETVYNAVMICNGHYFDPYVATIPGIETFPGTVMHSHSYRKPEVFAGKSVLILGAAASGIDIAIDLVDHAARVYLSHNNERLGSSLQSDVTEVLGVERVEGERIILMDQSYVTADVFLFCTGYNYSFPFLQEDSGIRVNDNYISPLYKQLINIEHPTMCIVGVPSIVLPFPMFDVQVQYFLAVLENRASLPAKSVMQEASKLHATKKRHAHKLADRQWDYFDSLADGAGFHRLPKFYKLGYNAWGVQRKANHSKYKKAKFVISEDGETIQVTVPGT